MVPRHLAYVTAVLAVSLLAVGAVATPTFATTGSDSVAQQQVGGPCNYAELYDETIDSVISVQREGGQGSGFVYDVFEENATSYVITNAHVVGEASTVTIQFRRGETATGTVVGTDTYSDLAVIRVGETPDYVEALPVSEEPPEHGQRVAALGSPFGLEETITHGIVSGLNRSMPTQLGFQIPNVVQTDAPISPGNSGGPLVACTNEVVGVNTAGIAAQGAENIGFAIPSTTVQRVVPALVKTGEYDHPALGIRATAVTPEVVQANDLNVDRGVIVVAVNEGVPAADVLQPSDRLVRQNGQVVPVGGDVIVAVENQSIATTEELASVLESETRPGDEISLTIVRDGERMNVATTVVERPDPSANGTVPVSR